MPTFEGSFGEVVPAASSRAEKDERSECPDFLPDCRQHCNDCADGVEAIGPRRVEDDSVAERERRKSEAERPDGVEEKAEGSHLLSEGESPKSEEKIAD
ncbi:MAG: hypothetical protein U0529_14425 [Thermoanaerobaculia bacterium]